MGLAFLGALMAGNEAAAQGFNRATVNLVTGYPAVQIYCGTGTPASGRVTVDVNANCSNFGFSGTARASSTNGVFKYSTSVNAVNTGGLAEADVFVEWYDKLVFGSAAPASVTFSYALNGRSGVTQNNGRGICTGSSLQINLPGARFDYLFAFDPNVPNWAGMHCDAERSWQLSGSTTVSLAAGTTEYNFSYFGSARSYISSQDLFFGSAVTAGAWSDFGSTGGITGVEFRDVNGALLEDVEYSFAQGLQFYDPNASAVPEPASWALTLAGMAGLIGVVRARRRNV
jgi:hypothetical protein